MTSYRLLPFHFALEIRHVTAFPPKGYGTWYRLRFLAPRFLDVGREVSTRGEAERSVQAKGAGHEAARHDRILQGLKL